MGREYRATTELPFLQNYSAGGGGMGVKIQKNQWGIIFGPKMMILQGVRR